MTASDAGTGEGTGAMEPGRSRGIVGGQSSMTRTAKTAHRKPKPPGTTGPRSTGRLQVAIDAAVKREVDAALKETEGNVAEAARLLGISRRGMWARLGSLSIDPATFRK